MTARRIIPATAMFLCVLWIGTAVVTEYTSIIPRDPHGYNGLIALIAVNLLLFLISIVSLIYSFLRRLSWTFTLSLVSVAPLHYIGAGIEAPMCFPWFLGPFAAVFITGIRSSYAA